MAAPDTVSPAAMHISWQGLAMISLYCFISGLSGVYTEYIVKRKYEVYNVTESCCCAASMLLLSGIMERDVTHLAAVNFLEACSCAVGYLVKSKLIRQRSTWLSMNVLSCSCPFIYRTVSSTHLELF